MKYFHNRPSTTHTLFIMKSSRRLPVHLNSLLERAGTCQQMMATSRHYQDAIELSTLSRSAFKYFLAQYQPEILTTAHFTDRGKSLQALHFRCLFRHMPRFCEIYEVIIAYLSQDNETNHRRKSIL